ncbi:MAG: hypothetical protein Q9225_008060, partial [Loekoesia sp. 1 TL-2023]
DERFELPGDAIHMVLSPAVGIRPEDQESSAVPLARNGSIYAPEVVKDHEDALEDDVPVLTATGLGPAAQAINGIQSPQTEVLPTNEKVDPHPIPTSPHLNHSIIEKQRQEVRSAQSSQLHGLLPSMLPQLRSLTLTDVPCYDDSGQVIDALIKFIRYCASEVELAELQVDLDSRCLNKSVQKNMKPHRQAVADIFALRRIILEMCPPTTFSHSVLPPGSPQTPKVSQFAFRTRSSTEDADSEAFWAAQEKDFSFFDDDVECGLLSVEPGSHFPISTLSEKMILPTDNPGASTLPTLQQPTKADPGRDVVQELSKFRRDRKVAYERALRQGHKTTEGYWPGEVKVVRGQGGRTATVDYYGNYFEKGYIYR